MKNGRLFRLARFSSKFSDWTVHPKTIKACKEFSSIVLDYGNIEAFREEWEKCYYNHAYLQYLKEVGFLEKHNLLKDPTINFSGTYRYPWFELYKVSNFTSSKEFGSFLKLTNVEVNTINDLLKGETLIEDWEWMTTSFRVLSRDEVASYYVKEVRVLPIPTQGDIASEIGSGPQVKTVWVQRIKDIYGVNKVNGD